MNTYSTACHSVGASFISLVIESLGGWDEEVVDVIKSIGRLLGQRLGISPAETMRHLFQRFVFCLCRGNAALWLHRSPNIHLWLIVTVKLIVIVILL